MACTRPPKRELAPPLRARFRSSLVARNLCDGRRLYILVALPSCAIVGCASPASHAVTRSSGTPILRAAATGVRSIDSRAHRSTEGSTTAGIEAATDQILPQATVNAETTRSAIWCVAHLASTTLPGCRCATVSAQPPLSLSKRGPYGLVASAYNCIELG